MKDFVAAAGFDYHESKGLFAAVAGFRCQKGGGGVFRAAKIASGLLYARLGSMMRDFAKRFCALNMVDAEP